MMILKIMKYYNLVNFGPNKNTIKPVIKQWVQIETYAVKMGYYNGFINEWAAPISL
jgi:hypothetical protein